MLAAPNTTPTRITIDASITVRGTLREGGALDGFDDTIVAVAYETKSGAVRGITSLD